ncbi:hypothetical protein C4577_01480 [Candidatus Parcubacteria bacterium]|nr:MAG: hypothetical protein C4577_01480 [Candidatus Parcubacteria bacterium]
MTILMKKIILQLRVLERNIDNWFLISVLFVFSLLRIPSLIEPYWYGDEGIYEVMGMAIRRGRILYQGILDNKPPMLYLIYSVFDGDQFYARLLSLIFGILAVIFIFKLSSLIFKKKLQIYLSTLFFALLFGLPLLEGNIANAENFMLAPIILSAILIIKGIKLNNSKYFLFSGLLLSFAFLTKIVAVFDFFAFLTFALIIRFYNVKFSLIEIKKYCRKMVSGKKILFYDFKNEIILILSFLTPILLSFVYFLAVGALPQYLSAVLSQNVGYVGWGNYFLFPMGLLLIKSSILLIVIILIAIKRKNIGETGVFILLWLSFSIFNALFASRTYLHYILVLIPSLTLFLGYILSSKRLLYFKLFILLFAVILITKNFHFYKKNTAYYKNYVNFVLGKKSVASYQAFFDRNTPRDYDIANFIKLNTKEEDNIFLWSDSAQIYALSGKLPPGRYTVAYHIAFYKNALEETRRDIYNKKPKYIIATKNYSPIVDILRDYNLKFNIDKVKIYERQIQ